MVILNINQIPDAYSLCEFMRVILSVFLYIYIYILQNTSLRCIWMHCQWYSFAHWGCRFFLTSYPLTKMIWPRLIAPQPASIQPSCLSALHVLLSTNKWFHDSSFYTYISSGSNLTNEQLFLVFHVSDFPINMLSISVLVSAFFAWTNTLLEYRPCPVTDGS